MDKEKILSKISSRDYYTELEEILEDKDFSEDVKNLLLSCIYKIEAGYKDYETVKRMVESKKDYLEHILKIIKEKCHKIEIIKKVEMQDLEKKKYEVDKLEGKITLWHPNEMAILYAIYEIDDNQIYVDEKYSLVRTSLSELMNQGENTNNVEVLRDFNGWNWNVQIAEIPDITINLVYQNLVYLLGISFLKQWVHTEKIVDYLAIAKEKMQEKYGLESANEFLERMNQLSILTCSEKNPKEKEKLLEEKKEIETQLARLNNKTALLNEISKNKKDALRKIKEIDTILNDKKRLEEEYVARNAKLPEYNKIFSLTHLTEILTRQRKKILAKIEEENKILDPHEYLKIKLELEKNLQLLEHTDLGDQKEKRRQEEQICLQKVVINCFLKRMDEISQKEEALDYLYMVRYYHNLYLSQNVTIQQEETLKEERMILDQKAIQKAIEMKVLTKVTTQEEINFKIFECLMQSKIINFETITIEIKLETKPKVFIYDGDILEKEIVIETLDKRDILIKKNKRIKALLS